MKQNILQKIVTKAAGEWYSMNTEGDIPELYIFDVVGKSFLDEGIGAKDFINALKEINSKRIRLFINSPGGSVFEGFAIHNALKNHKADIEVHVEGVAASIASVIAMAGDEIIMAENSFMMIHDPFTIAAGTAKELRKVAMNLDRLADSIAGIYAARTTGSVSNIKDWMACETWFTAADALEHGFATSIDEAKRAAACAFDLSMFDAVPVSLAFSKSADAEIMNLIDWNTKILKGEL